MSLTKYEYEVLMESGIIREVEATDADNAIWLAEMVTGDDYAQAYRKVGTIEWIVY